VKSVGFGRQEAASSRSGKDARRGGEQRSAAQWRRAGRSPAECEPGEAQGVWFGGRIAETAYCAGSLALTGCVRGSDGCGESACPARGGHQAVEDAFGQPGLRATPGGA
jgi:hypothetical protein